MIEVSKLRKFLVYNVFFLKIHLSMTIKIRTEERKIRKCPYSRSGRLTMRLIEPINNPTSRIE